MDLDGIMLSRNRVEWWGRRNGEMLVKVYKLLVIRSRSSGYLMYSIVIIVNNTVL